MSAELRLGRNTQASVRMVALASLVGGALTAVWIVAADRRFEWGIVRADADPPWAGLAVVGALVTSVVALVVVFIRQPKGARITWDAWGVTEWDGDAVRTSIAAPKLHKQWSSLTTANLPGRGLDRAVAGAVLAQSDLRTADGRAAIGGHLVLSDEDGRRIDVTQGVQNATLNRRLSTVDAIAPLAQSELVTNAPQGSAAAMPESENLLVLGYLVGIFGYLGAFGSLLLIAHRAEDVVWVVSAAAALILGLRSLSWWVRARRLRRGDRGAVKIAIEGGSLDELHIREAGTSEGYRTGPTVIDLRALKHPDAGLALRTGEAWLVRGANGEVRSIETTAAREARHQWARATRIEAALRTLVALLVLVPAAPQAYRGVRELARGVEGVQVIAKSSGYMVTGLDLRDGHALLSADPPKLLDVRTGEETKLSVESCLQAEGRLSPEARYALLSCDHGSLRVFALPDGRAIGTIDAQLYSPLVFDGPSTVVTGDSTGEIAVWDLASAKKQRTMPRTWYTIESLAISPVTHEALFTGSGVNAPAHAQKWGAEGQRASLDWVPEMAWHAAMAFSPNGKRLALVAKNGVELYDYQTGAKLGSIAPKMRGVTALAFSPDGRTLAIATESPGYGGESNVYFTDASTMRELGHRPARWRRSTFDFVNEEPKAIEWRDDGSLVVLTRSSVVLRMTRPD
jgi:hypothetical protein